MDYEIYDGEERIDLIVADEAFVRTYCEERGYTYKKVEESKIAELERMLKDSADRICELESVIDTLLGGAFHGE